MDPKQFNDTVTGMLEHLRTMLKSGESIVVDFSVSPDYVERLRPGEKYVEQIPTGKTTISVTFVDLAKELAFKDTVPE